MTVYILQLVWILSSGSYIFELTPPFDKKYQCLHTLTQFDKVIQSGRYQQLRCIKVRFE